MKLDTAPVARGDAVTDAPAPVPDRPVDGPRRDARIRRIGLAAGWLAVVLPFGFELLAILRANHLALVRRLPDDAFYYLEIAAHTGRGDGFTFDGIHSTNGFHPLWQILLVPLVAVLGPGSDAAVRGALILALLCCLVTVLLVIRLVWRITGPGPALLGGIVATQFALSPASQWTPSRWVNGMEGPVVMLTLALLATALAATDRSPTTARAVGIGLLSATLVLARLDFVPIVLIIGGAVALRWRSPRRVGQWLIGVVAIGVPAAAWWLLSWGHVLSTSATVKNATLSRSYSDRFGGRLTSGYAHYVADVTGTYLKSLNVSSSLADHSVVARSPGTMAAVAELGGLVLVALALLGWVAAGRRRIAQRPRGERARFSAEGWALGVVLVVVVAKAVLDIVTAPLWASQWYSAPQRLAAGVVIGAGAWLGVRVVAARSRPLGALAIGFLVLLALPVNAVAWRDEVHPRHTEFWQDQIDLAADWIAVDGPAGRYGAFDAGLLGHRLDGVANVVNLDGLVNDYEFAELAGENASLITRLRAAHVDYFVGRLDDRGLARLGPCGRVLWDSPELVPYVDSLHGYGLAPVRVVDVTACVT